MCIKLGRLSQGFKTTKCTNTCVFMSHDKIDAIPINQTVTYVRIVVNYRPPKTDPNRVRITAGGNLVDFPDELTTRTADLWTSKILWNSALSTKNVKYMYVYIYKKYVVSHAARQGGIHENSQKSHP